MSMCICYGPETATFNHHSVISCPPAYLPADGLPITHLLTNLGEPPSERLYTIGGQMGSSSRELLCQPVTFSMG